MPAVDLSLRAKSHKGMKLNMWKEEDCLYQSKQLSHIVLFGWLRENEIKQTSEKNKKKSRASGHKVNQAKLTRKMSGSVIIASSNMGKKKI